MTTKNSAKAIAEKIIHEDAEYESATYDAWSTARKAADDLQNQLVAEMQAVMVEGESIIEEMGEGETLTSTWGRQYTEQEERQESFEEVFNNLAYELGLQRDGTEFWEPSNC